MKTGKLMRVKVGEKYIYCQKDSVLEIKRELHAYGEITVELTNISGLTLGDRFDGIEYQGQKMIGHGIVTELTDKKAVMTIYQ